MKNKIFILFIIISSFGLNVLIAQNASNQNPITIHANDTPLADVLEKLAKETGYNIVTGPNVNKNEALTVNLDNVDAGEAINLIVRAAGLSYEIVGNSILIATHEKIDKEAGIMPDVIHLKYANAKEVAKLLTNITTEITIDKKGNNLLINASPKKISEIQQIINKIDVPGTAIKIKSGGSANNQKITIHATDQNLHDILNVFAQETGYNIVTGPNVDKNELLTIHLDDSPIGQAIDFIVRAAGLNYEISENSILVAQELNKEDPETVPTVITLKYANAEDISKLLGNITEEITVDKSGNNLLINATPKKIIEIKNIIKDVDLPATQIMLEARLIEVSLGDDDKMGIDWAKLSQLSLIFAETGSPIDLGGGNMSGSLLPGSNPTIITNESGDTDVIETLDPTTFGQLPDQMYFQRLNANNTFGLSRQLTAFDVTLDFLLKNNKADILANSQVVTLNGHEATISMVDIVPYVLSSGGLGGQVQVQREEVGIKLHIIPSVNKDGFITTKVTPEVSTIYDFIGPDRNIPWIKKRTSTTTIRVKEDETIIIAGLLSADKKKVQSRFPLLWRIPWLGPKFFTHSSEVINKTDLIIQITPKIIDDENMDTGIQISNSLKGLEADLMNDIDQQILQQLISEVSSDSEYDDVLKLQKALGMDEKDIDGKWGDKIEKYLLIRTITKDSKEADIIKLQEALGMDEKDIDGKWGAKTEEYLEKY